MSISIHKYSISIIIEHITLKPLDSFNNSYELLHSAPILFKSPSIPTKASSVPIIVLPKLIASTVFVFIPEPLKIGAMTAAASK